MVPEGARRWQAPLRSGDLQVAGHVPTILQSGDRMQLYGGLASPYVARVVLFARLKGLDLAPQMPEGGLKTPAFLALNPIGKMPTLVDGDAAIIESEVICEYLEDLHPGTGGLPGDAQARARARTLTRIGDLYLSPHVNALFRQMNPATRDAAAVEAAAKGLQAGLGYLEHFLTADPFAAGPQPSLADCALLPNLVVLRATSLPVTGMADPTAATDTRLGRWWRHATADAVTGPFVASYEQAFMAFMKAMAGGAR
jgi:glutathione S-transferase